MIRTIGNDWKMNRWSGELERIDRSIDRTGKNEKETEETRTSNSELSKLITWCPEENISLSSVELIVFSIVSKVWKDFLTARRAREDNTRRTRSGQCGSRCRDSSRVRWLRRIDTGRRITKLYAVYKRRGTKVTVVGGAMWRWIVGSLACNSR